MSTKDQDGGPGRHEEHGGTMGGAWVSFLGSPGTEITSDGTYMSCLYTSLPLPTLCPALQATGPASLKIQVPARAVEIGGSPHWESSHVLLESDVMNLLPCWLPVFLIL